MRYFTVHAGKRAQERGISLDEANEVVDHHEVFFNDPKGNPCYIRSVSGRRIKVVLSQDDNDRIVTVIDLDQQP